MALLAPQHLFVYIKVSGISGASTVHPAPTALEFYRPMFQTMWEMFGSERLLCLGQQLSSLPRTICR